jgi:hypothetical protein
MRVEIEIARRVAGGARCVGASSSPDHGAFALPRRADDGHRLPRQARAADIAVANARFWRAMSDLTLETPILKEAASGLLRPLRAPIRCSAPRSRNGNGPTEGGGLVDCFLPCMRFEPKQYASQVRLDGIFA